MKKTIKSHERSEKPNGSEACNLRKTTQISNQALEGKENDRRGKEKERKKRGKGIIIIIVIMIITRVIRNGKPKQICYAPKPQTASLLCFVTILKSPRHLWRVHTYVFSTSLLPSPTTKLLALTLPSFSSFFFLPAPKYTVFNLFSLLSFF